MLQLPQPVQKFLSKYTNFLKFVVNWILITILWSNPTGYAVISMVYATSFLAIPQNIVRITEYINFYVD